MIVMQLVERSEISAEAASPFVGIIRKLFSGQFYSSAICDEANVADMRGFLILGPLHRGLVSTGG